MKILGINDGHGCSVAVMEEGQIKSVYEEERFTRLKMDSGFPKL